MYKRQKLTEWPIRHNVGAISVGLIGTELRVDLDYAEDSTARADLNVVATDTGLIIEVQGGAEDGPVTPAEYVQLLTAGTDAVQRVMADLTRQLAAIQGL